MRWKNPATQKRPCCWVARLKELAGRLPNSGGQERDALQGEIWVVLKDALVDLLTSCFGPARSLSVEDIEDLASDLSVALLGRIESGLWVVRDRSPQQVAGYLAATAKNAAVDMLRSPWRKRRTPVVDFERIFDVPDGSAAAPGPDQAVDRDAFVQAFLATSRQLQPRECRVWLLRVLQNLTHQELCSHPKVRVAPGNLCVILHRTSRKIRRSLERNGYDGKALPPGTFLAIREEVFRPKDESGNSVTLAPPYR